MDLLLLLLFILISLFIFIFSLDFPYKFSLPNRIMKLIVDMILFDNLSNK